MTDEACINTLKAIKDSGFYKIGRIERTALEQAIENTRRVMELKNWLNHPDNLAFQLEVDTINKGLGYNPYQE